MNKSHSHTKIAISIVLLFGLVLFFIGTDGFRAFTAETARTSQLIEEKPKVPDVLFEDSEGRTYSISEFEDKYVFMTFIYTSCTSICYLLEHNMAEVYDKLPDNFIGEDIIFLSVSFDPTRDDPTTLDKYKDYFNSDGESWRMARIPDQTQLNALLNEFGVIVIPDGNGHYSHNSAFYLVNPQGHLVDVMDYTKMDEAADKIVRILENETGE